MRMPRLTIGSLMAVVALIAVFCVWLRAALVGHWIALASALMVMLAVLRRVAYEWALKATKPDRHDSDPDPPPR